MGPVAWDDVPAQLSFVGIIRCVICVHDALSWVRRSRAEQLLVHQRAILCRCKRLGAASPDGDAALLWLMLALGVGESSNRSALNRWLEVHERWAYDEDAHRQVLKRLVCLCTDCHHVTHYGHSAKVLGIEDEVFSHLVEVTKMTPEQAETHVETAFALWRQRSRTTWDLDMSMLTDAGIVVVTPPGASERPVVAVEALSSTSPPGLLEHGDEVAPARCNTGRRSTARSFLGRAMRHR